MRAGIPLAGASDAPVVPPSPWVGIAAARARRTAAGATLGAAERLDAAAALRLFTTGAAFALDADGLGTLAPGGPADLVVGEPDPLRVAPDDARFALPETGLGMIPGVGGTQTLPRRAGAARALDLVLTGRWLDARAALAAGLVHRVVARARLEATALALAHRLARLAPAEVQAARRAVRGAHDLPLAAGVALE